MCIIYEEDFDDKDLDLNRLAESPGKKKLELKYKT